MAIKYRTSGPWGGSIGRDLEPEEVDSNFYDLAVRVLLLEENPPDPTSIDEITVVGGQMVITLTDASEFGPFPLPVAKFSAKGDWAATTNYSFLDLVTVAGLGTYMVLQDHTSASTFDPEATSGGNPLYHKLFDPGAAGADGADGADGSQGPQGIQGEDGIFFIDDSGPFASRSAFDDESEGFTYYSEDGDGDSITTAVLFIMGGGGSADWTGPYPFQGPAGPTGGAGAQGPAGTSADWNAEGDFAGRDAYDSESVGFRYLSSNGDNGSTTSLTSIFVNNDGMGGWDGPFIWQGPQGPQGDQGDEGPQGPAGSNFNVDATGTYSERDAHDSEAEGYSYLSTNGDGGITTTLASIFIMGDGGMGDWGDPIPFQGPQGDQGDQGETGPAGPTGPQGPAGTNFNVQATGTFAGRDAYDAQAQGFRYLSTNGDGSGSPTTGAASIYIKASNTNGDWGPRIPFQGPQGVTGPKGDQGDTGATGVAGAPGTDGVGVPTGGAAKQALVKTSGADFATEWATIARTFVDIAGTTYTLQAGDELKYLRFTNAAGCTITVPDDVFAANDSIPMRGVNNKISLTGSATPNKPVGKNATSAAAGYSLFAFFTAADAYDLDGNLEDS